MKIKILNIQKTEQGTIELPVQFQAQIRPDLIKKAVLTIQANKRQPYGAKPDAGKRQVGKLSRRRHAYKSSYGHGISRVPRKITSRRGARLNWVGAVAPGTVGGRRAHPPKAEKIWTKKMNKKENRKAICSALAATMNAVLVRQRGHKIPANYPFIVDSKLETINKTNDIKKTLETLGFKDELQRCEVRKIRAGKGTMRGRKYNKKKGPLLVVSKDCPLLKSAKNIPGVDIVPITNINAELLAPGTAYGRATLFTKDSIELLRTENLFTLGYKGESKNKEERIIVKKKTDVKPEVKKEASKVKKKPEVKEEKEVKAEAKAVEQPKPEVKKEAPKVETAVKEVKAEAKEKPAVKAEKKTEVKRSTPKKEQSKEIQK